MAEKIELAYEVSPAKVTLQCDNCRHAVPEGTPAIRFTEIPPLLYSAFGDRRCWGSFDCLRTTVRHNMGVYPDLGRWFERHEAEIQPQLRPTCPS